MSTDIIVEIGEFGNNIYNLSSQYPIVYGILSIFIALSAGIFVSLMIPIFILMQLWLQRYTYPYYL